MTNDRKNPLRIVIRYAIWTFLLLFFAYLLLNILIVALQFQQTLSVEKSELFKIPLQRAEILTAQVAIISDYAWNLFAPFIQLALLFFIVDWILTRFGIDVFSRSTKFEWNIQTVIALIVVSAFAIAALGGIQEPIV